MSEKAIHITRDGISIIGYKAGQLGTIRQLLLDDFVPYMIRSENIVMDQETSQDPRIPESSKVQVKGFMNEQG